MVELLAVLNSLSPLAVIALLALIIFLLVQQSRGQKAIAENHLHGLPEMAAALERIETQLNRLNEHVLWIRARMNGK